MPKDERETDRFEAVAEDGRQFILVETTEFIENRDRSGITMLPGPQRLHTLDGQRVDGRTDGTFQLLESGLVLRRKKAA